MRDLVVFVLGGGRGTRLYPLTKFRSKPAVPLAGKYRLIDIPLSNCINSGLNRIYVLTQFMSVSLHRHIRQTYRFDLSAAASSNCWPRSRRWTTARTGIKARPTPCGRTSATCEQPGVEYVLILSGDQLYRMDYREMIARTSKRRRCDHRRHPGHRAGGHGLGIMRADDTGRVDGFVEKPKTDAETRHGADWIPPGSTPAGSPARAATAWPAWASTCSTATLLVDVLTKTALPGLRQGGLPASIRTRHVQVHLFDDYWEDIGTIKAFYDANLSLAGPNPPFELARPGSPDLLPRSVPAADADRRRDDRSQLDRRRLPIGKGAVIENSIIGLRCMIGGGVTIRDSILMGADYYEGRRIGGEWPTAGRPIGIGAGSVIEGAIVDKNCRIGRRCGSATARSWSQATETRTVWSATASRSWSKRPRCPTAGDHQAERPRHGASARRNP